MASSTFFIPSVNVIGADSLTDAMNMMAPNLTQPRKTSPQV